MDNRIEREKLIGKRIFITINNIIKLNKQAEILLEQLGNASIVEILAELQNRFEGAITFSTSFSFEDQVILHHIVNHLSSVEVFTLDTGRLFPETYSVWSSTNERFGINIKAYYPRHDLLETFVHEKGPNAFYKSVDNRKTCCHIRKVEPLHRALKGNKIWITGLRAEHSPARKDLQIFEYDEANEIIKFHPLLYWTTDEVKEYINQYNIPYNSLHDKGFVSIGCAPCTRAINEGEDFRAGRWWWEDNSKKECGLHSK